MMHEIMYKTTVTEVMISSIHNSRV